MADPHRLAAALAPFHQVSKHLQATQARLSALIAAVTGGAAARTGNLERLPGAALFNPFPLLPKVIEAANGADSGAKAGGRGPDKGRRATPTAAARPGANATAALAGLASAADTLRQAPRRASDLPPSAAARTPAAQAAHAGAGGARAGTSSAGAASVGELIEAVLQGHVPPAAYPKADRRRAPTARSGGAAAAGAGESAASAPSVGELINAILQGHAAPAARREAGPAPACAARSGAAAAAGAGKASARVPAVGELIDALRQGQAAPRPGTDTRPGAGARPMAVDAQAGTHLQHATDALRSLVAPLLLRPDNGAGARESGAPRASERPPLLRAPSRLLGAAAPGAQATATPAASAQAWATPAAPPSGQPADGPAELAAGLERLLREQAWLRGVDLT